MKFLTIDTSTNLLLIVLHDEKNIIEINSRVGKSDHQAYIVPMIEETLKKNQVELEALSGVIVGIGPGSYTGLRVGLMTAKMLCYAKKIPLYTVSSLMLLTSGYDEKILAWHDARNNDGFSGFYEKGILIDEEKVRNLDNLTEEEKLMMVYVNPDNFKLNIERVVKNKIHVENYMGLVPNYLRKTEAEVKLDHKSE